MGSEIFRDIHVYEEHFPDRKAAVGYVGEIFVAKGYAKKEYFEYIKKNMVENEAYMVTIPHFVLLHSVLERGALENVFHFMKLEHPVESGHESNDPMAYVITSISVDADSHTAGISLLAGMPIKEGFMKGLSRAGNDESLAACIRKYEEQEKDMLKANTACINGMGSSLILKMTMEKVFKELGVDAQVTHIDAGQLRGRYLPDMRITTSSLVRAIGEQEEITLITTKNFTDTKATKEKIREALNIEEQ